MIKVINLTRALKVRGTNQKCLRMEENGISTLISYLKFLKNEYKLIVNFKLIIIYE